MTEAEWLDTHDTKRLLDRIPARIASPRKMRLFIVACCRTPAEPIQVPRLHDAIDLAERFADGKAVKKDLERMWDEFRNLWMPVPVSCLLWPDSAQMREAAEQFCRQYGGWRIDPDPFDPVRHAQFVTRLSERNNLLRCIVGNPFRLVAFDPRWQSETVVALATGIYAERAFDRLPILADALEEAGCDHPDVLAHCRDPHQPHARGCWVVDGVLGKV